jgi:hypothetical protein
LAAVQREGQCQWSFAAHARAPSLDNERQGASRSGR